MLHFANKKTEAFGEGVACQVAIWGKAAVEPRAVSSDAALLVMTPTTALPASFTEGFRCAGLWTKHAHLLSTSHHLLTSLL